MTPVFSFQVLEYVATGYFEGYAQFLTRDTIGVVFGVDEQALLSFFFVVVVPLLCLRRMWRLYFCGGVVEDTLEESCVPTACT